MDKTVQIGNRLVGPGQKCLKVAEIGINHNGIVEDALRLIDVACEAGCDAVKFQKRTVEVVYSEADLAKPRPVPRKIIETAIARGVFSSDDVRRLTLEPENTTNGDLKRLLEFNDAEYRLIDDYCREKGIMWFASPWDELSVDFLEKFDPPCYKVASACLTDLGLLKRIKDTGRPVIMATGMSSMDQVRKAYEIFSAGNLIICHTISTYPAERSHLNLRVINSLAESFPVPIGYSGHERGTTMTVCAVALGACLVERHITLCRDNWGSDQSASLEPQGLRTMVNNINDLESALGNGLKDIHPLEVPIMKKLRRVDTL